MIKTLKENLKNAGKDENEIFVALSYLLGKSINETKLLKELDKKTEKKLVKIIDNRIKKDMPLDIIFKSKNFFGREFFVNKNVLTPRQETELLVERALQYIIECNAVKKELAKNKENVENINSDLNQIKILDLCSGSGCIGLTILEETKLNNKKLELENRNIKQEITNGEKQNIKEEVNNLSIEVTLSDISKKAIGVAKKNAKNFNLKNAVKFNCGHLFDGLKNKKFDIIVCNPPYINETDFGELSEEVKKYDPKLSLVARNNGYYFYEKIIMQTKNYLSQKGVILFEVGIMQSGLVCKLLSDEGFETSICLDYNNIDRIVIGKLH